MITADMMKREVEMLLNKINEPMREYLIIAHEKQSLVLYEVDNSGIVDAKGETIRKVKRLNTLYEGSLKGCTIFLKGIMTMNGIGGLLHKKYMEKQGKEGINARPKTS